MSGTQRYISTSFWDDEWIQTLDPSEKLLYMYLMTNPLTNIAGVYKISVRRICFDTGFNADTIGHIMRKFQTAGKAFRIGEFVAMPAWPKHQKWEKAPKIRDGIIACLKELDSEMLETLIEIKYRFDMKMVFDTLSIPYPYPSSYLDTDIDKDTDIDNEETPAAPPVPEPEKAIPEEAKTLAFLLAHLHNEVDPTFWFSVTEKQKTTWAEDIDKLHRIDKRDWKDIEAAIRWAKKPDCFWFPNIMSGKKLREKFPTIWAQMSRPAAGVQKHRIAADEYAGGEW
jgi:hypothetical protein